MIRNMLVLSITYTKKRQNEAHFWSAWYHPHKGFKMLSVTDAVRENFNAVVGAFLGVEHHYIRLYD